MQLTRDADYFICSIYKEFLLRVKQELPKSQSKRFSKDSIPDLIPKINSADISDIKEELKSKSLITRDILGNIELTDNAIIYMENRRLNKLEKIIEYLSKLIP